ncbi:MAG: hypothetical protein RL266_2114 [Bacteroidota bacterium]|jgi:hypothetical protein
MPTETNYIRQANAFYQEAREWQSETNSLMIDLMFLQRILGLYALKIVDQTERNQIDQLNGKLGSFISNQLQKQINELKLYVERLQKIVNDQILFKDRELPYVHQEHLKAMNELRSAGGRLKTDLYDKVEQLKRM